MSTRPHPDRRPRDRPVSPGSLRRSPAVWAGSADPIWLAPGEACDLVFEAIDAGGSSRSGARRRSARPRSMSWSSRPKAGASGCWSPIWNRRSSRTRCSTSSPISSACAPQVAEITRRAMNGEIDFAAALTERVALLQGLPERVLDEAAARIRLMPGRARSWSRRCARRGAQPRSSRAGSRSSPSGSRPSSASIGSSPTGSTSPTGTIAGTVATADRDPRDQARDAARIWPREHGIPLAATLAVGDGANDLPMLAAAGLGVAFRAKPAVAAAARWRLDHADLTGLLYAQGYRRDGDRRTVARSSRWS